MKKMECVVVINMQLKPKKKERNTFLHWKVTQVDLHPEVLVLQPPKINMIKCRLGCPGLSKPCGFCQ